MDATHALSGWNRVDGSTGNFASSHDGRESTASKVQPAVNAVRPVRRT